MSNGKHYVLGVDPGLSGAIAFFEKTEQGLQLLGVRDMPIVGNTAGTGNTVDLHNLSAMLKPFTGAESCVVYIEQVGAMSKPGEAKQGVSSMFKFGRMAMAPEAIAVAYGLGTKLVTPGVWKKDAGLIKKPKDAALATVKSQFPAQQDLFSRKKDVGRADATLIGYYGHRRYGDHNGTN